MDAKKTQQKTNKKIIWKKLDGNYARILGVVLNKSCNQYPTKEQLYSHLPLISETIPSKTNKTHGTQLEKQG